MGQNAVGVGKGHLLQIKVHLGGRLVQHLPERGIGLVQVRAHAGVLAALPGV